jgi:hypothetical protein
MQGCGLHFHAVGRRTSAMNVHLAILMLVAGDRFRARTMVARVLILVTVGKSELGSFRSFRFGGWRSTSSRIVRRTIRDCGHSRQIRAGFVSQFPRWRPVLGFGLSVGRTIRHCRHSRQIGAGFVSQSSRRRPALIRRRLAHILLALKASHVYPIRFGRAGRLSMNEKENIAHVI